MAWYNITCRSGGSNMNPGASDGTGEEPTAARLTNTNGGWDSGTGVFTCSGSPDLSGLVVGWLATVALDADTTPTSNQFSQGRIASFDNTAKTVTLTGLVLLGTGAATGASGRTLRVGGACLGPTGAGVSYPINFATGKGGTDPIRINLKNDATYSVTAGVTTSGGNNSIRIQGYTSTFGDGGKFVLDGGTSGASYTLLTVSGNNTELYDAEIRNNGATGNALALSVTGALCDLFRVTVHDVRGSGVSIGSFRTMWTECLTYSCGQANASGAGGWSLSGTAPHMFVRCVARDNTLSNNNGWNLNNSIPTLLRDCIADSNGARGFNFITNVGIRVLTGCDAYGNVGDGFGDVHTSGNKQVFLTDCNFVANGGYGINLAGGTSTANGRFENCGFGSGTAANTSGATNSLGDTRVDGSVTYDSGQTPWNDPANGDFTVTLAAAKGRGTGLNFSPTVSYPDRAAAQGAAA